MIPFPSFRPLHGSLTIFRRRIFARLLVGLLTVCFIDGTYAQGALQTQYDDAYFAWDAGRYPAALDAFQQILQAPGGDRFLSPIALLTGELYRVDEVAPDGRALRWHPNGRFAAFETGDGTARVTHIVALEGHIAREVAAVAGYGLVFSPTHDRVAYLAVEETPELEAARARMSERRQARDFRGFFRQRREVARIEAEQARIWIRDLSTGETQETSVPGLSKGTLVYSSDGSSLFLLTGPAKEDGRTNLYALREGAAPKPLTKGPGLKTGLLAVPGGRYLLYTMPQTTIAVYDLATGETRTFEGTSPAVSADGSTLAYLGRDGEAYTVNVVALDAAVAPHAAHTSMNRLDNPALSPDGQRVAFQMMLREDWELFVAHRDSTEAMRLTREIQHDLFPAFLSNDRVLAVIGEGRHRRSYLYDVRSQERTRLFHNNTIRTVAPEYEWAPSPDGTRILIVSERDGDTISPERAVYLLDLMRRVTKEELLERIRTNLAGEQDLRERGRRMFEPIADEVRTAVQAVSTGRVYDYEQALYQFDSKFITQPGNRKAIEYLAGKLRSFGYEPELQWFEPRPGVESANVIATLPGIENPELVYVISSHFDSVSRGPGADDNTSGTTALLEAARVLARRPMPATIKFAFFTGEEAGLLGSREFVRRAVEDGVQIMGALNNDMVGWSGDHRLDNTIRYSNAGIRDVQHAAAIHFTNLITYDAKYYKSTDAHAYYDAYGDIVGGIGSYPILGNPHYHQSHDYLETINHQLVAEVSKTTVATIMLLASSPARLKGVQVMDQRGSTVEVVWMAAPERTVQSYVVSYGSPGEAVQTITVAEPRAVLERRSADSIIAVKAVNDRGMTSWDWGRPADDK
ncbi:MAG: M20/M25/M40 family metallo-hydrolase [Rhodothermales bacterium]